MYGINRLMHVNLVISSSRKLSKEKLIVSTKMLKMKNLT